MSSKFVLLGSCASGKYISLDARSNDDFAKAVSMFGTVDLLSAEAQVTIPGLGGYAGLVAIGFVPSSTTPTQHIVRACTTSLFATQRPEGELFHTACDLSVFGKELKGVIHANDPPKLVVWPTGFNSRDWTKKQDDAAAYSATPSSTTIAYARLTITIAAKAHGSKAGDGSSADQ